MQFTKIFSLVASMAAVASALPMEAAVTRPTLTVYQGYNFQGPSIALFPTLMQCQNLSDVQDPEVALRRWYNSISSIRLTLGVGFCVFFADPGCTGKALAGPSAGFENLRDAFNGAMNDNIESYICFGTGPNATVEAGILAGKIIKDHDDAINPIAAEEQAVDKATGAVPNALANTPVKAGRN